MRRNFLFALLALTLVVLTQGTISMAQGIPQGSYQQTCNNVAVNGNVLSANCQDSHGNWINAQLPDVQRCGSDITNDNGALRCAAAGYGTPAGFQSGNGPSGSYAQSCQDIHVGGDDLHARCQTRDGGWHETKLDDYNKCRGDILNDNGNLKCVVGATYGAPGVAGGYPAGLAGASYTQTCKDIKSHGDHLEARCKTPNGEWHNTNLDDFKKCRGQIINDNGNLRCVAVAAYSGPGGYQPADGPNGSYIQSCKEIHANGDDLHARCQTGDGGWHNTKLDDYNKCHGDIVNDNGNLHCIK
jgi:CVNH domain